MSNENLLYNIFPLKNEVNENDAHREGSLLLEYFQATITIATNEGTVEVPTNLDEVLGLIDLSYSATAGSDPTDTVKLNTDGVITSSAVTVSGKSVDIANGDIVVRGFLVGKRSPAAVSIA
jgi:hypothetical protein